MGAFSKFLSACGGQIDKNTDAYLDAAFRAMELGGSPSEARRLRNKLPSNVAKAADEYIGRKK